MPVTFSCPHRVDRDLTTRRPAARRVHGADGSMASPANDATAGAAAASDAASPAPAQSDARHSSARSATAPPALASDALRCASSSISRIVLPPTPPSVSFAGLWSFRAAAVASPDTPSASDPPPGLNTSRISGNATGKKSHTGLVSFVPPGGASAVSERCNALNVASR